MKLCPSSKFGSTFALAIAIVAACSVSHGPAAPAPAAPQAVDPVSAHPTFQVKVSGQGLAVIFIAGLACPGEVWAPTVAKFPNVQAHVLSLAGFGGVPPVAADPFLPQVRDEVIAYIRAQKLEKPVIVGHSLGGLLALWIAQTAPELVGRLVVVDALPFLPAMMNPAATAESMKPQVAAMAKMAPQSGAAFAEHQQKVVIPSMVKSPENVARIAALTGKSDGATVGRAMGELMTTDLRASLAGIRCPVLVLGAAADRGPKEGVRGIFETQYRALPGVRLELIDDARHFIMDDAPEAFAKALSAEFAAAAQR
ncbi:MAG: alpha/beta hydrolase [Verrucomicrobia bacterium]|nr:alpha/beta hydrolase [Verrucomicrobiota bacterium]